MSCTATICRSITGSVELGSERALRPPVADPAATRWAGSQGRLRALWGLQGEAMTLDDIPADVRMEMTHELQRLFRAASCVPTCHVCNKRILVGHFFALISLNGRDEMVGDGCTKEQLRRKREIQQVKQQAEEDSLLEYKRRHPGYTRLSKVAS